MTIDPDRDLLIFKIREERKASAKPKKAAPKHYNISFDFKKEKQEVSKEAPEAQNPFVKAAAAIRASEGMKEQQVVTQPIPEKRVEQKVQVSVNQEEQMKEMNDKIESVLDVMRKINERQKIISSEEE